ncbi:uncharacterized protein PHACADRAFT_151612 [Phanerochaete carnosa HHB-10118-sp]|uniref:Peptidase M20 dimerisation domain-containing protein n=1 Tax=Phanerochaete carnosa (strain HHB-10118-sp) TaxID=650164 RepID=K5VWV3_PHACS|nr:uncharacterized protein PHACADRAFT_151612 [Phanerochaete carnosa HHB-10118-sp]EKM51079.1 hypothetical protein PHACADRAFT_151612 [Phanerochaete carnosa HHB-10118-sp]
MASTLNINTSRINADLMESCQWGSTPDGGMNRLTLNDDDRRVREWFISQVKKYGCTVRVDAVGNIFATRPGTNNDLPPIGLGSHLDTQPAGGKYDGIVGVHSALEVLKSLHDNKVQTYAPIAVINWTNEEGARFPPAMLGSGVWAGKFSPEYAYERTDLKGVKLGDELERIGFKGNVPASREANPLSAHYEVHIEQGPVLEAENKPIGVVTGVQAISWFNVELRGREQHCGTTPMDRRADTLLTAAQMIVAINGIALSIPGSLASVAVINSTPQSINTLASVVQFNIDARAKDDETLARLEAALEKKCHEISKEAGVEIRTWDRFWNAKRTVFNERMVGFVRETATENGFGNRDIQSGAGHDSVYTASRVPTSMIFIRCKGGISHNPAEYSSSEDIAAGAQVLLGATLKYDAYLKSQVK